MTAKALKHSADELQVMAYLDYRDFLAALYKARKAERSPYSYEAFAVELGLPATNALRLVIARKRLLAAKSAQAIVDALGLKRHQRKYFLAMVDYANARSAKHRETIFERLVEAKQQGIESHRERERLEYFTSWCNPVARELLRLHGPSTPEELATKLHTSLTTEKLRRALALLESLGVAKAQGGRYALLPDESSLVPADAAAEQLAMSQYHQSFLDVAKEAVAVVPAARREFNALTVCLSEASFAALAAKIQALCLDTMALDRDEKDPTCVAQLNIQLFALSERDDLKEE